MKLISKFLLLVFCILSISVWAQAPAAKKGVQRKTEPMPMPLNRQVDADDHLHMLTEQLDLTKAQQSKIRPVLEQYIKQRQSIELNDKLSPDEISARLKETERSSHAKIRTLLTAAQKKRFDDIMGTDEDDSSRPPAGAQKKK